MFATDSFKALANRTGMTVAQVRATADDLGLEFGYDSDRRTWVLNEDPTVVRMFNDHLAN